MGLPPGPSLSPRRQALGWIMRPEALMERALRECGDVFRLVLPLGPVVAVCEPAALKEVFTGDPALFRAGEANAELAPAVGPESLLLLDGPRHLRRRRLVLPPFHGDRLARYAELIGQIAAADVRTWPRGRAFALEPRMRAITLEVILRVVFGIDDARRLAALRPLFMRIMPRGVAVLGMLPVARRDLGGWSPWARFGANIARIDEVLLGEIARRRADPALPHRDDVLSMLLLARDDNGQPLTDRELRDELMTLLLAGHETTTVALAWTFELLFRHPRAFERSVAAARGADAAGTPWLDAVVSESLRLKPPLPMVVRRLAADAELAGYRLPAGTRVAPCIYLTHRRPDLYPRPTAFSPERFLGSQPETYAWLPFGGGIRRCVGASFAQLEMRVVLKAVLAATDLGPASGRAERTRRRTIVLAPEHGARAVVVASAAEQSRAGGRLPAATPSARAGRRTPVAPGRGGR